MTAKSQLGVAAESTYGTYTAPTKFFPFRGEGLTWSRDRIESQTWEAGSRVVSSSRWKPGQINVAGTVELEAASKDFGIWFAQAFGAGTTTTPGTATARLHTYTLGDLVGKSMTVQAGIEDRGGTVRPFSFTGCKVSQMTFNCAVGDLLTVSVDLVGQDVTTAQALGTASYASSPELFSFVEGTLTIEGGTVIAKALSLAINNQLSTDDYTFGSALMREAQEPALRQITGTLDCDFDDLTHWDRFYGGSEATLVALFQTSSVIEGSLKYQIELTANVRYDGETPTISGPEAVRQPVAFAVTAPAAGTTIALGYQNTDTSYT